MTAEDPVEYNLRGVNQVQVNDGIGLHLRARCCAPSCARTPT